VEDEKEIVWLGSAYRDLLTFSVEARRQAGFQLGRVQAGLNPKDWKAFDEIGSGTRELRVRDDRKAYRVLYVAKFAEAVYVLHCFEKKTQVTRLEDRRIAAVRYGAVIVNRDSPK
jgi:phage-related protein